MYQLSHNNPHKPIDYRKIRAPGALNLVLYAGLDKATSDHAQRLFKTRFAFGQQEFSLRGLTWNILMYAKEAAGRDASTGQSYSNNPLLVTEDDIEYMHRKIFQVECILEKIQMERLDYVFLQEADFFDHRGTSDWLKHEKPLLVQYFRQKLAALGFELIYKNSSLVTLYNAQKLELLALPQEPGFPVRGHRNYFKHKATRKTVVLTNMHLPYGQDHGANIQRAFEKDVAEDYCCIMGGDANHSPDGGPNQLITDPLPSNVAALDVTKKSSMGCPVLSVTDETNKYKAYDGLFVRAPENVTATTVVWGEYFALNQDASAVEVKSIQELPFPELVSVPEPEKAPAMSASTVRVLGFSPPAPPATPPTPPSRRGRRGGRNNPKK